MNSADASSRSAFVYLIAAVGVAFGVTIGLASAAHAQQVPDSSFAPSLGAPAFRRGTGPVVLVDEGHHNFHTLGGRFYAFGRLVASDGFITRPSQGRITSQSLAGAKILVISNALAERNIDDWMLPTPSAFDSSEIAAIRGWVESGGGLLLIADHMPFPGAVSDLAAAFGFQLANGFLFKMPDEDGDFTLSRSRGELRPHAITDGKSRETRIDSVHVFTGEGFRAVAPVETLLVIRGPLQLLMPQVAWQFSPLTPRLSATGLMQGAVRRFGKGRVGMFGEAAMFSAQLAGPRREPMGMNSPAAPQNARFVRNVVRWLAQVP